MPKLSALADFTTWLRELDPDTRDCCLSFLAHEFPAPLPSGTGRPAAIEVAAIGLLTAMDRMQGAKFSMSVKVARNRLREALGFHPETAGPLPGPPREGR